MVQPDQLGIWVVAARRGDQSAASKLLAVYHPILKARAKARMDRAAQGRYEPEDVLQQVYLQVVRQLDRFDGPDADAFLNWVSAILDNKLIDAWRAAHRQVRDVNRERPAVSGNDASSCWNLLEHLYAESGTPSRVIRRDEALEALLHCVSDLAEPHRRVIQLRFLEGLSVEEVAQRLETSKTAIVARTRRALEALRKSMDRLGEFTHGG